VLVMARRAIVNFRCMVPIITGEKSFGYGMFYKIIFLLYKATMYAYVCYVQDIDVLLEKADALLEQKKYAEALKIYKQVLAIDAKSDEALWNGGLSASKINDYKTAEALYLGFKKQHPKDGSVMERLIQLYETTGEAKKRDAERLSIIALHRRKEDTSDLATQRLFCRERYTYKDLNIFACEYFSLVPRSEEDAYGTLAPQYLFLVDDPKDESNRIRIEVGWDSVKKDAKGEYQAGQGFYFDAYYRKGDWERKAFGVFEKEIPYADIKKHIVAILEGKVSPTGGTRRQAPPDKKK
jgi:tetratricopeptide (TPR) repeat protein